MKKISILLITIVFIIGCNRESYPFLIDNTRVGQLTKEIRINQLDSIFPNDSIVRNISGNEFLNSTNNIEIYDKDGSPLLILEPVQQFDTLSTIGYIQILDPRYETLKGLNINSNFGDVVEQYRISRIENTLNSAVIFIDELNLYLTIDKRELPSSLRYDTDTRITASQIPDNAKIKYFMISW
ncbi:hypothetical protein [Gillisia limnaea]|uniref:Secreted protein n=1 Tax=Gillisia limnaea (strain DSM 15749 / LMG 21470 / R-8282) TaxID=865937 RepID=H2BY99_GILLR|nr:hypothetical protein [Gillisia limnaea]EHQ02191.1 hypothetical protein Gilli_1544 [Gillisia limnaea DSM 15749]